MALRWRADKVIGISAVGLGHLGAHVHRILRREQHLKQLRGIRLVALLRVVENVEQVSSLESGPELLDCLDADALDTEQLVFGLADQIANHLDTRLAELVGPALADTQVVEEVELGELRGKLRAAATEVAAVEEHRHVARCATQIVLAVERPLLRLRQQTLGLAKLLGSPVGQAVGTRTAAVDALAFVGEL